MKNKVIILLGKSASGKSTIEKRLESVEIGTRAISTTTRKPRTNEKNGVDYYFVTEDEFNKSLENGEFVENSEYPMVSGNAKYGINKKHIDLDSNNVIAVLNPDGMRQIVGRLGKENIVSIYIKRNDRDRVISALSRDESDLLETLEEVLRRVKADKIDFDGIENEVDYVVENDNMFTAICEVIGIINKETKQV